MIARAKALLTYLAAFQTVALIAFTVGAIGGSTWSSTLLVTGKLLGIWDLAL